jgi:hypothetical protein
MIAFSKSRRDSFEERRSILFAAQTQGARLLSPERHSSVMLLPTHEATSVSTKASWRCPV